jgi:hypothetical protein
MRSCEGGNPVPPSPAKDGLPENSNAERIPILSYPLGFPTLYSPPLTSQQVIPQA